MSELILREELKQARYYVESLAEGIGLDMVYVPGGTFVMGSPEDEPERTKAEGPQHEVTVPAFFMGRYPVTQAQWRFVAELTQVDRELKPDPSDFKGNDRPVETVSWYEAVEFCARLSRYTNREYRLPSEAEWEYACRANTTTPFYFGRTVTTEVANYKGNSNYADGPEGEFRNKTTLVNHFKIANAFGLSDMHGNVWEWCQDHWHENYEGAPEDENAWIEGGDPSRRILRGGSWEDDPKLCRSASRIRGVAAYDSSYVSFRVVCSPPRTL